MTEERALVLQAVIDGQIGVEHVTIDEIFEAEDAIFEESASMLTPFTTWETLQ